ncbi:MAG TPA: hypothetical protein IAD09_06270 [Candidatus Caccoplasma merdavium]|nr:hypothetical protein [Candidatus Caccoplasma merdavium]
MKLRLVRRFKGDTYTIGSLSVNGEKFCDTLEDRVRDLAGGEAKVPGETAIPEGRYKVIVNRSPKFGRDLPRLLDVPMFEGVLIHRGNTAEDSAGCILVGENKVKGKVINSTPYEEKLVALCKAALAGGETIEIEVV